MVVTGQLSYPSFKIATAMEQAVGAQKLICLIQERPEILWIHDGLVKLSLYSRFCQTNSSKFN